MIPTRFVGPSATSVRRGVIAVLAGVPLVLGGDAPVRQDESIRNAIVVTLDTTRADRLPAYGYRNLETPALDRLAREGIVFDEATTSAPLTLPAHCTIFTGLLPPHHGVRDNSDRPLADSQITLAEILRARGRRTGAFVGSVVVGTDRGLAQGFDSYSAPSRIGLRERNRRSGPAVMDEALAWLRRTDGRPFFEWIHLYDAHAPYTLPEPYRTMYRDVPYLGALALLDAQIARVIDALETLHELNHTVLVIAGDHGESLGEHGENSHGILLYQSTLHVPLLMRVPGLAPRRVIDVTTLADVMPTLLDLLGVQPPATDGVTLVPLMRGRLTHRNVDAYAESLYPRRFGWSELYALRSGRYKFIDAPRPELYDLESDPDEQRNLIESRSSLGAVMRARLHALSDVQHGADRPQRALDAETAARLTALGYVGERAIGEPSAGHAAAIDPKDCIGRYNEIVRWRSGLIQSRPDARLANHACNAR